MKVVIDIEANSLRRPTNIWLVICKEVESGRVSTFRNIVSDWKELDAFLNYTEMVTLWIGHNLLGYDGPVVASLTGCKDLCRVDRCIDTLILSKMINYSRPNGHSIEAYGEEFGLPKGKFNDWTKWSQEMEDYCLRDVEITEKLYLSQLRVIDDPSWSRAIRLEHDFQLIANLLHDNGFGFDTGRAKDLLDRVTVELKTLDDQMQEAFPPKEELIREFIPKLTKFGTISRTSVPRSLHPNIHAYDAGQTYRHTRLVTFNPDSHKQRVEVLNAAGWKPINKTDTHVDCQRSFNLAKRKGEDTTELKNKLDKLNLSGWKVDEDNLDTLPPTAPLPARLLAKRIQYESRRRTLTEWLGLVEEDGRIHGRFQGIGAWTHRMAHQKPNTANISREFKEDGSAKLLGREMRECWIAPEGRLLVGVDAEGIQLRIFAHYIDDKEFTDALVTGRKSEKTDPHSLNQGILGSVCKTRQAAKRFVYALLLGGGLDKLSSILGCSKAEAREALDRLLHRYTGFDRLRKSQIPADAKRGWFTGLDGRSVLLPGLSQRDREHLCMSGYLQNGEAIIIKKAAVTIDEKLRVDRERWKFVNIVHDELQSEVENSMDFAIEVAKIKAEAIRLAGEEYNLKCPMAGSYWNDDMKDYTIGSNWYKTH